MTISEIPYVLSGLPDKIPFSPQQDFLRMFDKGDEEGIFGPRYHIVEGWRLRGELDVPALRAALDDVVARHEALRTVLVRDPSAAYQTILSPSSPSFEVRDLHAEPDSRDLRTEEFVNEIESGELHIREVPALRAVLGRFDDRDAVLVLLAHHTAADAWSMQVVMRDLAAIYATRRGHDGPPLPEARQYQEHALEQSAKTPQSTVRAREFWREKLRDGRITALPTDRLRSQEPRFLTGWHRFLAGEDLGSALSDFATSMRSSQFMVLLAAYNLMLHDVTGATDIVVPTFTAGRGARMQDTVGSFFNMLPLRTDLAGCATFREVVTRTRATCLASYPQEIPLAQILGEVPELMMPAITDGLATCVFQVIQTPHIMERQRVGDVEYSNLWKRLLPQPLGSDIPDGSLWSLQIDPSGAIVGAVGYSSNIHDASSIRDFVARFDRALGEGVRNPDAPLHL